MLKYLQIVAFIFILSITAFGQQGQTQLDYIEVFKEIAIREMDRAGVPASIKLAQGILESNSGQSTLARRAKNHFGIKCGSNWQGDSVYKEDDDYDANGKLIKSCFRSYKNGESSYVAHSEFLRDPRKAFRYGFLFRLDPKDYRRWAYGLKQAGYATSATYPEKLISLIERYKLYEYDNLPIFNTDTPSDIVSAGILQNNDVRYVVVGQGETLEDIARNADINVRNLIQYNENLYAHQSEVNEGDRVYLQPKRNAYRGREKYHTVKQEDSMFGISQEYAVKLDRLFRRNKMEEGEEPAVDEKVKLRGCKVRESIKLRSDEVFMPTPTPNLPDGELEFEEEDVIVIEEIPEEIETPPVPDTTTPINPEVPNSGNGQTDGGGLIIIPQGGQQPTTPPVADPVVDTPTTVPDTDTGATGSSYHTVQKGDTLYSLSRRYGTTVEAIKTLNGLTSNNISLGARLRIK